MCQPKEGYFPWTPETIHHLSPIISFFHNNGYAVLTSHASKTDAQHLRAAAAKILTDFHQRSNHSSVFTTDDAKRTMDNAYFLESANNISCFLEEEQETDATPAVNKIGHALHDLDAVFAKFSRSDSLRVITRSLGITKPLLIQSMYILKNPRVGGAVTSHRDSAFVRGQPAPTGECLGYWWALEDATLENGCLWAVPGSHKDGKVIRKLVLKDGKTAFVGENDLKDYHENDFVALPMRAGDLIVIHGDLVHRSLANRSEKSRHAYSIHVVEGSVTKDCWLQRSPDFPVQPL